MFARSNPNLRCLDAELSQAQSRMMEVSLRELHREAAAGGCGPCAETNATPITPPARASQGAQYSDPSWVVFVRESVKIRFGLLERKLVVPGDFDAPPIHAELGI